MLEIYAGSKALKQIKEEGFHQALFTSFLAASGGAKFFSIYQINRFLFDDFFKGRDTELNLLGSSAGAFQSACIAQNNPSSALDRLAINYAETTYSKNAKPSEITAKARTLLDNVLGENGVNEILNNKIFKPHFVVAKSNGLVSFENKYLQGVGLLNSYIRNKINRRFLNKQYQRFVYHSPLSNFSFDCLDNIDTFHVALNEENLKHALLASGSIPMVMEGIKDIPHSPKGMYRDGGIIDYHFDLKLNDKGLTIYPHFNSSPKAGWFDKNSKRTFRKENYDKTVLICPSSAFINSLPYSKIPDRNDFITMDDDTRIKYWKKVFEDTKRLVEELQDFILFQRIEKIKPL